MKDETNKELSYWPIGNLVEGQSSEAIRIRVDTPDNGYLKATDDARAEVWAKWTAFPDLPFRNISSGPPIHLEGIAGPFAEFEVYVKALSPIDGFERVPLTVIHTHSSAAGWAD